MKRILLPTDFSDNAYNAIAYAIQLFKDETCEFFLLHTYSPVLVSSGSMIDSYSALSIQKIAEENALKEMDGIEKRIERDFPNQNHDITSIVSFNLLIPEMKELGKENNIDLIVMGTQGATGAKEIFIGTNTMYAIKKMKIPVLAVPSKFTYVTPKEILFPTDYKINRNNKYIKLILTICKTHISRLHILNAYYGSPLSEEQEEIKDFLDTYFREIAPLFHSIDGTDVLGSIEMFQNRERIDMLVMIHNRHSFFENILFRPIINQIVYHTQVPFLIIPSVERQ